MTLPTATENKDRNPSHQLHAPQGGQRSLQHTTSGPGGFCQCCKFWWCWGTFHSQPSSTERQDKWKILNGDSCRLKKKDKKQCSPKDSYFHSLSPQHPLLPIALLLYLCLEHLSRPLFTRIIPAFPARTYPLTISSKEKLLAIACPGPVLLGHLIIL